MNRSRVLTLCGLLIACGGKSQVDQVPASGSEARAGSGGSLIGGEPPSCVTPGNAAGIMVDVFPLPEGPRLECHALAQPGSLDSDCPNDELIVCSIEDCYEAATLAGCCRSDGFCGLLETGYWGPKVALGCISRAPWIENADELDHSVVPVRCN